MLRLAIVFLAAFALSAEPPKRSWEWTLEERLTERHDPSRIRERLAAYERAHAEALRRSPDPDPPPAGHLTYVIDGRRNPELFLSHELFDALMSGLSADSTLRTKQRGYYGRAIRAFGFDDATLWTQLESVAGPYLVARTSRDSEAICPARYDALQAARALFGRERFDEFLYVVIAPSLQTAESASDPDFLMDSLRKAERGCR
jgi:hypothetical protein